MKKLFFALAAVLFAACSTDLTEDVAVAVPDSIEVSFEEESRIQLSDDKTVWTKGDLLSVFYRSDANEQWKFQGNTGDRSGSIKRVMKPNATTKLSKIVAVYPYNENYYINPESCNIEAMLPAEQTYLKDSYGLDGNILVSQSEFNQIALRNVCGWLKIQLKGDGQVIEKITLKGNNNEQVAGLIYIDSSDATSTLAAEYPAGSDDGVGGTLILDDTILKEVTLNCGEGVTLGAEPTAFYVALPPQEFSKGLTVEIKDSNSLKMIKSTDKAISIERNHIQPMATIAYEGDFDKSEYCLTTTHQVVNSLEQIVFRKGEIAGTENALVNIDYGDGAFGKDQMHTYPAEGTYTVKYYFEKPITEICPNAFTTTSITSITIPKDVVKIGSSAFSYTNLTSISFEENSKLSTIELGAFIYCRNIKSIYLPTSVTEIGDCVFGGCYSLEYISGGGSDFSATFGLFHKEIGLLDWHVIAYPASLNIERVSYGPIHHDIGWGAFVGCKYLKELDIIISKIYQANFMECEQLEYIRLDQTIYIENDVIKDCPKLKEIHLPRASEIGKYCFINNESLTNIHLGCDELRIINSIGNNNVSLNTLWIPSGVESITDSFNSCSSLASVYCKAAVPPVLANSFDSMVAPVIYVPAESVNSYKRAEGWKEFADCIVGYDFENGVVVPGQPNNEIWYTATTQISPNSSDVFGANIISNKWDAETGKGVLQFDGDVTMIGENAFGWSRELTSIDIPESVTTIGNDAFQYCYGLHNVYIPDSVTSIGRSAFLYCDLKEIVIPDNVITIGAYALCGCSIQSVIIPNGVTDIADGLFKQCDQLTTIVLGNQVTSIGDESFSECTSLTSVTMSDNVNSIGYGAFDGCTSLTSVTIPDSVNSIEPRAFAGCTYLKEVYCKAMTPPSGYSSMFTSSADDLVIYVPRHYVEDYKAANGWGDYADRIEPYDFE